MAVFQSPGSVPLFIVMSSSRASLAARNSGSLQSLSRPEMWSLCLDRYLIIAISSFGKKRLGILDPEDICARCEGVGVLWRHSPGYKTEFNDLAISRN